MFGRWGGNQQEAQEKSRNENLSAERLGYQQEHRLISRRRRISSGEQCYQQPPLGISRCTVLSAALLGNQQ
ncbi:hypothetical protein [Virgibacillus sediminis]|uniref:Uncharacterized protein n=1 Tax=Virgibacillus sediminis TaxID=202260 RepID=A0ABV7A730_9BACI